MLRMITNRSPSTKLKPLPRAAQTNRSPSPAPLRGFPLPLWRGVNGIANNELITVSQTIVEQGLCALFSNKKQGYLLPSPTGRGWGVGLLYIYAILRAFSETHQITVWKHGFQVVKPRVSGRETKGFRVWNQGFCKWGVSLLKSVRKRNDIGSDCYNINKYFVKRCKIPFLHIYTAFVYLYRFCIFMQVLRTFAVLVFYLFLPFYFFCHVETKT